MNKFYPIDLRDIIENKDSDPETYQAWDKALSKIYDGGIEKVADNEPTMIPAEDFTEYAQELAEDIGSINRSNEWPLYCIDWEHAAEELKMDYTSVEVNGREYYFRSW